MKQVKKPLPINFPLTFMPERRLLIKLLEFSSKNGVGNKIEISTKTGIPTGASSGKVEPMIHYCLAMGLITAVKKSSQWQLGLTDLGKIIYQEDPFLSELLTLWLLHLMSCRRFDLSSPAKGANDIWFSLFAESTYRLGSQFTQKDFLTFLLDRYGKKSYLQSISSLAIRTYLEESCLGGIDVLHEVKTELELKIERQKAPFNRTYYPAYAVYFFSIWDDLFINENQISLDFFSDKSRCFIVMGWTEKSISQWLEWMVNKDLIQIDRYTGTPMVLRLKETSSVIQDVYSELI